jgi:very-short-patch-repair endonuclease
MTGKRNTASRSTALLDIAAAQHGVLSRQQMRRLGMSDAKIDHAVSSGRLHRVFRSVYAVGNPRLTPRGRLMAAALACGPGAVISHRSAAALLELLDVGPVVIDVIAPPERGRKIDGIRFHRVRPPRLEETGTVAGVPCTSPARTLVDLAGTVSNRTLGSAFERAAHLRILDLTAIELSIDPRRRGMKDLLALIEKWRSAEPLTKTRGKLKSPLEAKVLPLLTRREIPPPLFNSPVQIANGRIEVDFLWPDHRFVVEADSRAFHATHIAFERDRWRDRELLRAAYSVLRVTHHEAENEAEAVADTIAFRLASHANAPTSPG